MDPIIKQYLSDNGRKGGKRRKRALSPARRSEISRVAGVASGASRRKKARGNGA